MGKAGAAITRVQNRYGADDPIVEALKRLDDDTLAAVVNAIGFNVPSVAALTALNTTVLGMVSGANVRVLSLKAQWDLDLADTTTPADGITVALATPAGRWHRRQTPDPFWQAQTSWVVDSVGGNDENPGTALSPIRTMMEFVRRTGQIFEPPANVLVLILGVMIDGYAQTVISHGPALTIRGQLPVPTADVVAFVQAPNPTAQTEPQITLTTGWGAGPKKAKLCSFPATPSWAFAYDNDGALQGQITFPAAAGSLPLYAGAAMPAPGDPVLIHDGANFAALTNATVTGISSRYGSPAVVLETLRFTACRIEGDIVSSRCIWDDAASTVEITGGYGQIIACAQEATDGGTYTLPAYVGQINGSWLRFVVLERSAASFIDSCFQHLESVQSEMIIYQTVLTQDFVGNPGMYTTFSSLTEVHIALWGTPLSSVVLAQDASIYVDTGPSTATFNPTGLTVGTNGTPIPPLVPGAPVPMNGPLTTSFELIDPLGPFLGSAIEYMRNCRVLPA